MKRRGFFRVSASAIGGILLFDLDRNPMRLYAQDVPPAPKLRIPLYFFKPSQADDVAAATERIFPSDDSGPGARNAGVTIFIDRQLAGPYGRDEFRYRSAPFRRGVPEQGYQDSLTPQQIYREGLKLISGISKKPAEEQDRLLQSIETTPFFRLLRAHTIEGMFCDPVHGGNRDMIGWQLIGFPGPRMSYYEEIDTQHGKAYRPKPVSLSDVMGRTAKPKGHHSR
jgi:gluconate 2-dehydrogenase gamma chain